MSYLSDPQLREQITGATNKAAAYRRDNVLRFGNYDTATLHIPPRPYDSALRLPADGL